MKSTRGLCNQIVRIGVILVALVAMGTASLSNTTQTYASYDPEIAGVSETHVAPEEHEIEDRNGESELPWLFAVFFITWAAFFGYVYIMSRRQREMQGEIDALNRVLKENAERELQADSGPESRVSNP